MPYTLDNFTQQAPPALLAQAQVLVAAGAVTNLEKTDIEWLADVLDTDTRFDVAIAIGPRGELLSTCGCGDMQNDLCRHAVATLLTGAAKGAAQKKAPAKARAKPAKAPGKNTVEGRLRATIEAAPPAAVVDMLVSLAKGDKHLQSRIYIELGDIGDSFEAYTAAVQAALSVRGGIKGWGDAQRAKSAAAQVDLLLQRAVLKASTGDADTAIRMALYIFQSILAVLDKAYAVSHIEACAQRVLAVMQQALPQASATTRAALLQSLASVVTYSSNITSTRIMGLKQILVDLVSSPEERAVVEPLLMLPAHRYGASAREEIWHRAINSDYMLRYALITRLDGPEAARRFAQENVHYMALRALLIEDAVARNKLTIAYELASEGLRLADKAFLENVADGYIAQMVAIAEKKGESPSELYLRQLLRRPDSERWLRYKQSIPAKAWPKERTRILRKYTLPPFTLYMIYSSEAMWEQFMELLKLHYDNLRYVADELEKHGAALAAAQPTELANWCRANIYSALKGYYGGNRDNYREIGTILKLLVGLGLSDAASTIAARLRKEYATRSVLLDEIKGL